MCHGDAIFNLIDLFSSQCLACAFLGAFFQSLLLAIAFSREALARSAFH